jgi:hypothetical protein
LQDNRILWHFSPISLWGAQNTYVITGSGTSFSAKKNGTSMASANSVAIQAAIDVIRTDAAGDSCTIQFGDGTNVLDIGAASITFENSEISSWEHITLKGKIKSSNNNDGKAILLQNLPSNVKVEAYNLQGKQLYSGNSGNSQILRIQVQTKGMYIVKVNREVLKVLCVKN